MNQKIKTQNRLLSLLMALVLVVSMIPMSSLSVVAASTAAYNGTPVTPTKITSSNYTAFGLTDSNWGAYNGWYGIRSAAEMYGFAELVNGGERSANGVLLQDVVLNAGTVTASGSSTGTTYSWQSIGTSSNTFTGNFDGNGCTISGLYCVSTLVSGLFGIIGKAGLKTSVTIKNVILKNSYIEGDIRVGGIVGSTYGYGASISNCKISEGVTVCKNEDQNNDFQLGGIIGGYSGLSNVAVYKYQVTCSVTNCVNLGTVQNLAMDFSQSSLTSSKSETFLHFGAITGAYAEEDNAFELISVNNCYYIVGRLVDKNGRTDDVNGKTFQCGKGGTYNRRDNTGCTKLSSVSDSHTCVSVTHKEVKPTCQYPGCSEYSYCLICSKVTSGTKTETGVVGHNYTAATCVDLAKCVYCGKTTGSLDGNNHTGTASVYRPSDSDHKKHELHWSCCNALEETTDHSFDTKGYCSTCGYQCDHSQMVNKACQICGKSGTHYLNPVWDSNKNKMEYTTVLSSDVFTLLTNGSQTVSSGWYVVEGNVTINVLEISGTVNLVLADGATLACQRIRLESGNTLNVYAQSLSPTTAGKLTVNSETYGSFSYGIGAEGTKAGNLTINGGVIDVNCSVQTRTNNVGIGGGNNFGQGGTVTVNGGTVTVSSRHRGIGGTESGGSFNVNSGIVFVSSTNASKNYKYGIVFEGDSGTICGASYILEQDFTVPSGKTLTIEEGKILTVAEGTTLTIEGSVVRKGTIVNNGTIICKSGHTYIADCSELCDICSEKRTPLSDHKYDSGCDEVCNLCGEHRNTSVSHNYENGICKNCGGYEPALWNSGEKCYEISNAGQLAWFADKVKVGEATVNGKLTADIDASSLESLGIGTSIRKYGGSFDGNGHSINIKLKGSESVALFPYVSGATIKNLTVTGSLTASGKFAGGLVGQTEGNVTVEKCISTVEIISTVNGDGTHGGLIGVANGTTTINSCGFAGAINGSDTTSCGGFVGWSNGTTNINNSFVAATYGIKSDSGNTFSRGSNITVTDCYYLNPLGNTIDGATQKSDTEFESGEVTYLLNGSKSDGIWKQTLGTDAFPNFRGEALYFVPTDCGGKNGIYGNTKPSVIAHDYNDNGICTGTANEIHYELAFWNSDENCYEISNAGQLIWFSQLVNGTLTDGTSKNQSANAILANDIDMSGITGYTPIGTTGLYYSAEGDDKGYSGTFDGDKHVIKNLTFTGSSSADLTYGIFGTLSGKVKNLGVENMSFARSGNTDCRAGGIVGQIITGGSVTNCFVANSSINANKKVGGGIAGCNYAGTITNCHTYNVTVNASRAGGIVGDNRGDSSDTDRLGTVSNCHTTASDIQNSQRAGNVINCTTNSGNTNFSSGMITWLLNGRSANGIWKQTLGTDAYPCFTGNIVYVVPTDCGGKNGTAFSNTSQTAIAHVYDSNGLCHGTTDEVHYEPADFNTDSNAYEIANLGNLLWFRDRVNGGDTKINAILTADINGKDDAAKTIGIGTNNYPYEGVFDGNGKTLDIQIDSTGQYAAPFGYVKGATIKNLTVTGSITSSQKFAASFIGAATGGTVTLEKCISKVTITSTVSGDGTNGGLVANVSGGEMKINNCAFVGAYVTSTATNSGGFVGWTNKNARTYITNSFLAADFSNAKADGCNTCSRNPGYLTVNNCYYLTALGDVPNGATQKSSAAFENGEVTWLLNRASSDGVWKQTLGEDGDALPNFTGKTVYRAAASCDPSAEATYSNVPQASAEHSYDDDGFCENCKDYQPAQWNGNKYVYEISNAGQLYWFAALTNGTLRDGTAQNPSADALLTRDINVNTGVIVNGALASDTSTFRSWTPIGDYINNGNKDYVGTFDGNGHTVRGLYAVSTVYNFGFIGCLKGGSVKNLTVSDSYFESSSRCGGIVGWLEGTAEKCASVNCIIKGNETVGGIAGVTNNGNIVDCYSTGILTASKFCGGISGTAQNTCTIRNCYFAGVNNCNDYKSGIVTARLTGTSVAITVDNCYYDTKVAPHSGVIKKGSKGTLKQTKVEGVTTERFEKGEITWLLNGSKSDGVWKQTIGTDTYPNFTGMTVYYDADQDPQYYNEKLVSVTIAWTSMEFTYNDGEWQPASHSYADGTWQTSGGTVTVENAGDVTVTVSFSYVTERNDITGTFDKPSFELADSETDTATLTLTGKPDGALSNVPLGNIVVGIAKKDEQSAP